MYLICVLNANITPHEFQALYKTVRPAAIVSFFVLSASLSAYAWHQKSVFRFNAKKG